MIAAPWISTASQGIMTTAIAEAVDIMPTLIELASLPPCDGPCLDEGYTNSTPSGLQGQSLMPAIMNPPLNGTGDVSKGFKQFAFSQFPRCNCTYDTDKPFSFNGTCRPKYENNFTAESGATGAANHHVCLFTPSNNFDWMGYSVRSDTHRYTLYVTWNGEELRPNWNDVYAEELYDHSQNDGYSFDDQCSEPLNLLGLGKDIRPSDRDVADQLQMALISHFRSDN